MMKTIALSITSLFIFWVNGIAYGSSELEKAISALGVLVGSSGIYAGADMDCNGKIEIQDAILALQIAAGNRETVEIYPLADQSKKSDLYRVEVCKAGTWVDSNMYNYARQSKDGSWYYLEYPKVHWTTIGVPETTPVRVRITRLNRTDHNEPFSSVKILPSRYNITPSWDNDKITFSIKQNQKVYVRINNQDFNTLFVFATPPKPPVPQGAKYFGPGIHNLGIDYKLLPTEHDVYIDGGAWVVGSINITAASNHVNIMGPGVLSGEFEVWENVKDLAWEDTFPYIMIHTDLVMPRSFDVTLTGITIIASPFYNLGFYGLRGSKFIDNIHIISPWTFNTDGLNIGSRGHTTNTFVFNNDDTVNAEYIYDGNMTVSNCVLAGRNPFLIGYGYFGSKDPYHAYMSNIDLIIQDRYYSWHAEIDGSSSEIVVDNQTYENITIDGDVNRLIDLRIEDTGWGAPGPAQGNVRNISFKNVTVKGRQLRKSVIRGKDANNRIDNVQFTNLIIDGTPVTNDNCNQYFDIDWSTASVNFGSSD